MRTYTFNQNTKLLELKVSGTVTIEDLMNHYLVIEGDDVLPRDLKVLIDCRNTVFDMQVREIANSIEKLKNALRKYNSITEAIIVDQPFETAFSTFFSECSKSARSYIFQVFSTEEAARAWL